MDLGHILGRQQAFVLWCWRHQEAVRDEPRAPAPSDPQVAQCELVSPSIGAQQTPGARSQILTCSSVAFWAPPLPRTRGQSPDRSCIKTRAVIPTPQNPWYMIASVHHVSLPCSLSFWKPRGGQNGLSPPDSSVMFLTQNWTLVTATKAPAAGHSSGNHGCSPTSQDSDPWKTGPSILRAGK